MGGLPLQLSPNLGQQERRGGEDASCEHKPSIEYGGVYPPTASMADVGNQPLSSSPPRVKSKWTSQSFSKPLHIAVANQLHLSHEKNLFDALVPETRPSENF